MKLKLHRLAPFLLFTLGAATMMAQTPTSATQPPVQRSPKLAASAGNPGGPVPLETGWPVAPTVEALHELLVVTTQKPKSRQHCPTPSFMPDAIVCGAAPGKQSSFRREDVSALIVPRVNPDNGAYVLVSAFLAGGGAIIYGAVALASVTIVGAIPVAVIGAFIALTGLVGAAFSAGSNEPERLLYLAPGASLAFKLRK